MKKKKSPEKESSIISEFKKYKKKILIATILSFLITFASLAIVGFKFFYPFHLLIGISIYILSWIPLIRRVYLSRKAWKKYRAYKFTKKFFIKEKWRLFFGIIFVSLCISFFWLMPIDNNPFKNYTNDEIKNIVKDDLYKSVTAMDYLESTGNDLLNSLDDISENPNTIKDISTKFNEFLTAVSYSESLTDVHRYFSFIPRKLKDEKKTSFLISYSLYVKKYELVHRIMSKVSGNQFQKKILNQYMPFFDKDDIYNEMVNRFYSPKTRLRLSSGVFYMRLFTYPNSDTRSGSFQMLYDKSNNSYGYLFENFPTTLANSAEVVLDSTEKTMFATWFPIQKNVANAMGHIILSDRGKDKLITREQTIEMSEKMNPGDIMLQRRNWHLSNVGIPGYWTHSALYTGTLSDMDEYFASEFPYEGYKNMSSYLKDKFPNVEKRYQETDEYGDYPSVLESIEPGVVLQTLAVSAHADSVVVLRPSKIGKKDILLAFIKGFENFGKPYDYDFDFDTLDALVCSELIYDAYFEKLPEKKGINFETSIVSGRKMVSPIDIAEKFVNEYESEDSELSFVYFLRSNESKGIAEISDEKEFLNSINYSKFSFLNN